MKTNTHQQRLSVLFADMDGDELLELADFTMSNMIGKVFREIFAEEEKDNPDQELIAQLKKEEDELRKEKRTILLSDKETMRHCIEKYSPIVREMVSKNE